MSAGAGGSLGDRQAALIASLTAGAAVPPGFDARLVEIARAALRAELDAIAAASGYPPVT